MEKYKNIEEKCKILRKWGMEKIKKLEEKWEKIKKMGEKWRKLT